MALDGLTCQFDEAFQWLAIGFICQQQFTHDMQGPATESVLISDACLTSLNSISTMTGMPPLLP